MAKLLIELLAVILIIALLVYIFVCLWLFFRQDELLFQPGKWQPNSPCPRDMGLDFKEGFLRSGGEDICFWYLENPNAQMTVLLLHGNAGNLSDRIDLLNALYDFGLSIFVIDYRGYGKSTGIPTEEGLYQDARSAYDYMINALNINPEQIVIYGRSLGGAVAIDLVWSMAINKGKLIMDASFTSLGDISKRLYPFLPVGLLLKYKFDSIHKIKNIMIPVLFVYSKEDELIPLSMGQDLFEHCPSSMKDMVILKHGLHNDVFFEDKDSFFAALRNFLN